MVYGYCCVPLCTSCKKNPGLSFHEFPSNLNLRAQWLKAIRRENWVPQDSSYVCSKHFKDTDFYMTKISKKLKKGVVPSVLPDFPNCTESETPSILCNINSDRRVESASMTFEPMGLHTHKDLRNTTCTSKAKSIQLSNDYSIKEDVMANKSKGIQSTPITDKRQVIPLTTSEFPVSQHYNSKNTTPSPKPIHLSTSSQRVYLEQDAQANKDGFVHKKICIEGSEGGVYEIFDSTGSEQEETLSSDYYNDKRVVDPEQVILGFENIDMLPNESQKYNVELEVHNMTLSISERRQWMRKCRDLKNKLVKLQSKADSYLTELLRFKKDPYISSLLKIKEKSEENEPSALFLLDQISNYNKSSPRWSEETIRHSIILRHVSTYSYEHLRKTKLLKLPCRTTLSRYLGQSCGDAGFSSLVEERLRAEMLSLECPQSKTCSLVADEMHIQQRLQYDRQRDAFVGVVDFGDVPIDETVALNKRKTPLANSLQCFLITGLSTAYKIPVSYFFVKKMTGEQLAKLTAYVLDRLQEIGFTVVRLVTDNLNVNVTALKLLCGGELTHVIPHPCDSTQKLFLSFDPVHVQKNWRSQFLDRDMGKNGQITSKYVKTLYELQKNSIVKPVRFLTRKHLFPNNLEKMNVKRSVQLFLPPVTAALKYMKDQAGHMTPGIFAEAGPTIEHMEICCKWFTIHDTCNTTQHIHQRLPDSRHFDSVNDERLQWLINEFLPYIETLKKESKARSFFTDATYKALQLTTHSTVACIKYLLKDLNFQFVLTRRFSSDTIEALFGCLRRSSGCHDQLDVKATISGLEKILKTGIITATQSSNIINAEEASTSTKQMSLIRTVPAVSDSLVFQLSAGTEQILHQMEGISTNVVSFHPTPEIAALKWIGGYLLLPIIEKTQCESCIQRMMKPNSNQPSEALIRYQDRGGLHYPSDVLVESLRLLKMFLLVAMESAPKKWKPLATLVRLSSPKLSSCPGFLCQSQGDDGHVLQLCTIICKKFLKPLLVNYASMRNDNEDLAKFFTQKPLSRKLLKM